MAKRKFYCGIEMSDMFTEEEAEAWGINKKGVTTQLRDMLAEKEHKERGRNGFDGDDNCESIPG